MRELIILLEKIVRGYEKLPSPDFVEKVKNLNKNDFLVVYHGTREQHVPDLINGFDATSVKSRDYGGPQHAGLFVTPSIYVADRFASRGEIVLELKVRAANLHGTDWSGRTGRMQGADKGEIYPNSFRPYLSMTLLQEHEPQALLIGLVSPKQILRVRHKPTGGEAK